MKEVKCRNARPVQHGLDVSVVCAYTGRECPYGDKHSLCDLDKFSSLKPEAAVAEETLELIHEVFGNSERVCVSATVKLQYLAKKYEERKSK